MHINFNASYKAKQNISLAILVSSEALKEINLGDIKLSDIFANFKFNAKVNETLELKAFNGFNKVVFIGLGAEDKITVASLNNAGGQLADHFKETQEIYVEAYAVLNNDSLMHHVVLGIKQKVWGFDKYLTNLEKINTYKISTINLVNTKQTQVNSEEINAIIEGVNLAKHLITEPANVMYPATIVEQIKTLEASGVKVTILDSKTIQSKGMDLFLSVNKGSSKDPYIAIMEYKHKDNKTAEPLALVGKGVTFDTGGYSLKPALGMLGMKYDMSGAATVIGTMKALSLRKANANVVGIVGLVENMVSGDAIRPGDIVKAMNGKTVEILNTDAEGRLILADLLHLAVSEYKPKAVINLATLTGAIIVALGTTRAGLFCNNDDLAAKLESAGTLSGEMLWRLPVSEEYKYTLKSSIADYQNITLEASVPGSIFAALFLQEFVGSTSWAHLDIAGVAKHTKGSYVNQQGATAFGVKLLNDFIKTNYEAN